MDGAYEKGYLYQRCMCHFEFRVALALLLDNYILTAVSVERLTNDQAAVGLVHGFCRRYDAETSGRVIIRRVICDCDASDIGPIEWPPSRFESLLAQPVKSRTGEDWTCAVLCTDDCPARG